jgi:hypothetical protein
MIINDLFNNKKTAVAEGSKMARADKSAKTPKPKDQQEYDDVEKYRKDLAQSYNKEPNFGIKDDEEENKWWIDYDLDEGVAEGAKWRSHPDAYDVDDEGNKTPRNPNTPKFGYDPLQRRADTANDAKTPRGKTAALKTSLKMAKGNKGVAEVSQQTLQSYRKKASAQKRAADDVVSGDADDETWKKNVSLSAKRRQGIDAANKRLGVAEGPFTKKSQPYNDPNWIKKLPKDQLDALGGKRYNKDKKDKPVKENMADDMAAMAKKKFPTAYISKDGEQVQKPENWGKRYTPPPAAPADLEKQQRDLTAKVSQH